MRQLTKYFGTYTLAKYEKETGKGVMDLLDIGNFEVNKIANIIKLGNKDFKTEEEAYDRLDEYLKSDDEHSLITAYFDLIDELDRDIKILKSCGVKIEDLKTQFKEMAAGMGKKLKDNFKGSDKAEETSEDESNIIELPNKQED